MVSFTVNTYDYGPIELFRCSGNSGLLEMYSEDGYEGVIDAKLVIGLDEATQCRNIEDEIEYLREDD